MYCYDYKDIFAQANNFYYSWELIHRDNDNLFNLGRSINYVAEIVNLVFACELYMKSIIYKKYGITIKEHKLSELFHQLPVSEQNAFKEKLTDEKLTILFKEFDSAFVGLRYEYDIRPTNSLGAVRIPILEEFAILLRNKAYEP